MSRRPLLAPKLAFFVLLTLAGWIASCKSRDSAAGPPATSSAAAAPAVVSATPAPTAPTSAWKRALLWRIESEKKAEPSFVLGTIHLPDARLDVMPAPLERALDSADAVYTEIPMDPATQMAMVPKIMLPAGTTLESILPRDLYQKVEGIFTAKGLPFAPFNGMKPWAVTAQLALLDRLTLFATKKPLDSVVYTRAQSAGKEVGGIETADEQLALFDGLSQSEQISMLRMTVEFREKQEQEGKDLTEELLAAYVSGDQAKLEQLIVDAFDPSSKLSIKLKRRFFSDRNTKMSARMDAKLKAQPDKSYLFAVGAGHVVGADSVVAQLSKKGYTATQVSP
jgi:uncharacterized protein